MKERLTSKDIGIAFIGASTADSGDEERTKLEENFGSTEEGGCYNPQSLETPYKQKLHPESIHGVRGQYLRYQVLDTTIRIYFSVPWIPSRFSFYKKWKR